MPEPPIFLDEVMLSDCLGRPAWILSAREWSFLLHYFLRETPEAVCLAPFYSCKKGWSGRMAVRMKKWLLSELSGCLVICGVMRNGSVKDWGIGKWPKQKGELLTLFHSGKIRARWGDAIIVSRSLSFKPVFPALAWCSGNNLLGSSTSKVNLPSHSDAFFYLEFGPYHPEALSMHLFIYPFNPSSKKAETSFFFFVVSSSWFPEHRGESWKTVGSQYIFLSK